MYDWKYFVILVPASYVNVSENYNLHIYPQSTLTGCLKLFDIYIIKMCKCML
jgi:hypothetical protein